MLSSRESRFSWGKQDRTSSATFFGTRCRQWRPPMRKPPPQPDETPKTHAGTSARGKATRPVWTPWLWVD